MTSGGWVGSRRKTIDRILSRHREAASVVSRERVILKEGIRDLKSHRRCQKILQAIAQDVQRTVHERIASLVTRCLAAIFEDPYTFHIDFELKRGRTEPRFYFLRRDVEIDPMECGGVLDVACFALRVASLILTMPPKRRILFLDEPFRNLSEEGRNGHKNLIRARILVESLAKELGIQFVIVTHLREFFTGDEIYL